MESYDYREQLGIGFNDDGKKEYFFTIMWNFLDKAYSIDHFYLSLEEYSKYCTEVGVAGDYYNYDEAYSFRNVMNSLRLNEQSLEEFVFKYVMLVNCINDANCRPLDRKDFTDQIIYCFKKAHIAIDLIEDEEGIFIFPQGVPELDDALASELLIWLLEYPETRKKYGCALRKYSEREDSYSNIADEFRKALETFLQEFFNNTKNLENNKALYGSYLKSQGVPADISNNLVTLLSMYANYINNYAKHHDKAEENVLEFIMYQTGNIIRLLITIKNKQDGNS